MADASVVEEPTEVSQTQTETAVVVRPNYAPSTYVSDSDAEGEFTSDDQLRGRLAIVAKVGKLSNIFNPGDMLLNGEYVIGNTKDGLNVVAIGIKKLYQNDLDFDGGDFGETVQKAVQVIEKGGVVDYRPNEDKTSTHYWKPVLQVIWLIEKPEGASADMAALFPFEIEGKDYAEVGYWAASKTAYNAIAKTLIQAKNAKGSVRTVSYRLTTKGESNRDATLSWIQASIRATGPTSQAILDFIQENHG